MLLRTFNKTSHLTGVKWVPEISYTYIGLPTIIHMSHVTHSSVATRGLTNWSYLSLHGVKISCISLPVAYLYLTEGGKPETRDPDPSLRCTQWRIDTWRTRSPSSAGGKSWMTSFLTRSDSLTQCLWGKPDTRVFLFLYTMQLRVCIRSRTSVTYVLHSGPLQRFYR